MLQELVNYYWAHPIAVTAAVIALVLILIWMSGSGSRRRIVELKRTKESEQIARDLSRVASALERIAKSYEMPADFVGRPIPPGFEDTIAKNHANVGEPSPLAGADSSAAAADTSANPLGGTASLLGDKKKLNLPNPLYRPK